MKVAETSLCNKGKLFLAYVDILVSRIVALDMLFISQETYLYSLNILTNSLRLHQQTDVVAGLSCDHWRGGSSWP